MPQVGREAEADGGVVCRKVISLRVCVECRVVVEWRVGKKCIDTEVVSRLMFVLVRIHVDERVMGG
jgi:hypothetical protein